MAKSILLIKTLEILRQQPGITVQELAAEFGRSERSIYRWLSELSVDLGTPIYCNDGGYYLTEWSKTNSLDLMPEEILALRLSLKSAPFGTTSPIGAHSQSAWQKIRAAVSYDGLTAARDMAETHSVRVNAPACDVSPSIVEALETGVNQRCRLRTLYNSQNSGELREYLLDPYAFVFRRHSWYLIAFCHRHSEVRQFKLARFRSATLTCEHFEVPETFDVDKYFEHSWEAWGGGEPTIVKVRFSPKVAPMIEESKRHPTQILHHEPDGSIVFEVCVAGIREIAIWIMGYGKEAEVLEPESLRSHIYEHASSLVSMYSGDQKKVEQFAAGLT